MYVFQQRRKYVLHRLYLYSMYSKQAIYIISENDDLKGNVLLHLQIVFSGQVISKLIKDFSEDIHILLRVFRYPIICSIRFYIPLDIHAICSVLSKLCEIIGIYQKNNF